MYTNYKTITTKQLNELIKIMSPALNDNGHSILLKFFSNFIKSYANDNIIFINKSATSDFNEAFEFDYNISNLSFNIGFDIFNIIKDIKSSKINISIENSKAIENELHYFDSNDNPSSLKQDNPIVTYLPCLVDNQVTHYIVIDGNHRLKHYKKNNMEFNVSLIYTTDLKMHHFRNLNSFIAYHFISSYYYACQLPKNTFQQYFLQLENLYSEASLILSKYK